MSLIHELSLIWQHICIEKHTICLLRRRNLWQNHPFLNYTEKKSENGSASAVTCSIEGTYIYGQTSVAHGTTPIGIPGQLCIIIEAIPLFRWKNIWTCVLRGFPEVRAAWALNYDGPQSATVLQYANLDVLPRTLLYSHLCVFIWYFYRVELVYMKFEARNGEFVEVCHIHTSP